jgi:hypothetical protein
MRYRAFLTSLFALSCGTSALAATTGNAALKPIRTLTYSIDVMIGTVRSARVDAIGSAGSGVSNTGAAIQSRGTVTIDVIAATADGGLVVDVAENSPNRSRPTVRIAVAKNGELTYDPKQGENVTEEEDALVRWMARGFSSAAPDPVGTAWDLDRGQGDAKGVEHYRVTSISGDAVTLDYKAETTMRGPQGFDMTRLGSLVYDTKLVVPVGVTYQEVTHSQRLGNYDTTTVSLTIKLSRDTFKKT